MHLQNLHRRSMPVDDRELRASMPPVPTEQLSNLMRCTSYGPGEQYRDSCVSDSSDSVISSGSDSEGQVYKVVLLGEQGVGKSSLARIFGGVEDGHDCEDAGEINKDFITNTNYLLQSGIIYSTKPQREYITNNI